MNNKLVLQKFLKELDIKKVVLLDDYNDFYKVYYNSTKDTYTKIIDSTLISNVSFRVDFAKQYDKLRNDILEIYRCYVKGDILRASTKMNNVLFRRKYYGKRLYEYFLVTSKGKSLYRCRQVKSNEVRERLENIHDQMFHIAFNKRNLVGNCRFSVSGFPCLYLGSSIDCCEQEIEMNENDSLVTCNYKIKGDF